MIRLIILILLLPSIALATPAITGVAGTSTLTVAGSGFGVGPTIMVFDQFENGAHGDDVSLTATIGEWSVYSNYHPKIDTSVAHSGTRSMKVIDANVTRQIRKTFTDSTEVMISFWARIPDGNWFPTASAPNSPPTISAWKHNWFMDGPMGYQGDDDVCLPTHITSNQVNLSGNSFNTHLEFQMSNWKYDGWNRFTIWGKAGNPTSSAGNWFYEWFGVTHQELTSTYKVFNVDGGVWNQVNVPGWHNPGNGGANTNAMYDDVYISYGANAQARVEMCDAATWSARTHCELQPTTAWSDASITATLNQGSFSNGASVYYYVIDSTGSVSAASGPYTLGSGGTTPVTSSDKATGRYQSTQTVTLSTTAGTIKYCKTLAQSCTPTTDYTAAFTVLQNIAGQTVCVQATNGELVETAHCYHYRKQQVK